MKALTREQILEHMVEMKELHIKELYRTIAKLHLFIGVTALLVFIWRVFIN